MLKTPMMTSRLPHQTVLSRFARTAIAFVVLISSAMATDPLRDISTYTVCAGENQSFVLPQVCDVAYGGAGRSSTGFESASSYDH